MYFFIGQSYLNKVVKKKPCTMGTNVKEDGVSNEVLSVTLSIKYQLNYQSRRFKQMTLIFSGELNRILFKRKTSVTQILFKSQVYWTFLKWP